MKYRVFYNEMLECEAIVDVPDGSSEEDAIVAFREAYEDGLDKEANIIDGELEGIGGAEPVKDDETASSGS